MAVSSHAARVPRALLVLMLGGLLALVAGATTLSSRQALAQTPPPTVNLTGDWGAVYSSSGTTLGECTGVDTQTGGKLNGTVECEASGTPTGTGGVLTGTVSGTKMNFEVVFSGPSSPFTANASGSASPDGNTYQGNYGIKPGPIMPGFTYIASRLTTTTGGSNVTVDVPTAGTTVTFAEVTEAGGTTVVRDNSTSGTLPGQFDVLGEFYHVMTTAVVTGDINVCVSYQDKNSDGVVDDTSPPVAETDLRLLHNEGGTFVDRTAVSKSDYVLNRICAIVPGLSEFALGVQAVPTPTPTATPTAPPTPTPTPAPAVGGVSLDPTQLPPGGSAGYGAALLTSAAGAVTLAGGAMWWLRKRTVARR